jgi:hypothetical protein
VIKGINQNKTLVKETLSLKVLRRNWMMVLSESGHQHSGFRIGGRMMLPSSLCKG